MSGHCTRLAPQPVDHYAALGVSPQATQAQIKAAFRALVKLHHPDAGGDAQRILALNAAWDLLRDSARRQLYDLSRGLVAAGPTFVHSEAPSAVRARRQRGGAASDEQLLDWLLQVYGPIDRLLAQVINPFPAQLRALSADPYDDRLMETFCAFLEQGQSRLEKVADLYRSKACPNAAKGFSLSLYHCFSQVQDALDELERYTMGYVDSYLHDGREMLREAKQRRSLLQAERRRLEL